jgi:EamA domain-containing membrane protein RarD
VSHDVSGGALVWMIRIGAIIAALWLAEEQARLYGIAHAWALVAAGVLCALALAAWLGAPRARRNGLRRRYDATLRGRPW